MKINALVRYYMDNKPIVGQYYYQTLHKEVVVVLSEPTATVPTIYIVRTLNSDLTYYSSSSWLTPLPNKEAVKALYG